MLNALTHLCPNPAKAIRHTGKIATTLAPPREAQSQISQVPYLPGLDGLRALAVVAVMIFHANHDWLPAGFLGVEVFFVISGYLITLLLISEHERNGQVSLGAFWGRRFRRLLPALALTLVGVTAYCALFADEQLGRLRGDVVGAVFYVSNWFQVWSGQGYGESAAFVPLRHLWSLAVEEQFYLIWPLVMVVLLRRGRDRLPRIGIILIAVSFVIAALVSVLFHLGAYSSPTSNPDAYFSVFGRAIDTNNFLYLGTITRSGGIMLGAGFAMLWRPLAVMRGPMRAKGRMMDIVAIVALAGLVIQMLVYELIGATSGAYYPPLFNGGLLVTGLFTIALIATVTHQNSAVGRFLGNRWLNWVGTRSYGLYLFHWPIYQVIRKEAGLSLSLVEFGLALIATAGVAEASYRFVEMPVRRRQFWSQFSAVKTPLMVGLGAFGLLVGYSIVSLVSADVQCTTRTQCDAEQAARALEQATATTTIAPPTETPSETPADTADTSAGTPSTGQDVPTTPAPTTTAAPRVLKLVAVGESVMAGAATTLLDYDDVIADAEENRGPNEVRDVVTNWVTGNDVQVLVVQVGTNGPVTQAQYDAIAEVAASVPKVYFMTVKAPKDWIPANNAIIRALPGTYPNIQVIDWEAEAVLIQTELSPSDGGVHLRTGTAIRAYANLILAAAGLAVIEDPNVGETNPASVAATG